MDLYDRLAYFKKISNKQKILLFFGAIYNDARFLVSDKSTRFEFVKKLIEEHPRLVSPLNEGRWLLPITKTNWEKDIFEAHKKLTTIPNMRPMMKSFILNRWLCYHGFCPFVHYAFFKWHDIKKKLDIINLAELSTTYLYKLVPNRLPFRDKSVEFLGEGAYNKVYLAKNKETILKYPKNLAGLIFMNGLEILAYNTALNSSLTKYMAPVVSFDEKNAIIEKKYIEGVSGWELLKNKSFRKKPYAITQLQEIYKEARDIYLKTNINIDIHPGNFQWSYSELKWYLVDYGSMPEIGADYFPRNSFESYFQKIWLDLHELIKKEPIRSLDISFSLFWQQSEIGPRGNFKK